ncbi:translation initiation factor IF-2-like [Oenanthe melanoleuca]|uniref:translation initiation factor IF-2-like n=1 Tax=Oenanthe melanoleuca TaxID=2939378 RepID=UPI0024C149D5|nr:translation initiation factor IF-2-like [Oenanthe melanoleuca]
MRLVPEDLPTFESIRDPRRGAPGTAAAEGGRGAAEPHRSRRLFCASFGNFPPRSAGTRPPSLPPPGPGTARGPGPAGPAAARGRIRPPGRKWRECGPEGARGAGGRGADNGPRGERWRDGGRAAPPARGSEGAGRGDPAGSAEPGGGGGATGRRRPSPTSRLEAPRQGRALSGEVSPRSGQYGSPCLPHCKCGDSPSEVWLVGLRSGVRSIRGVESNGRPEPPSAASGAGAQTWERQEWEMGACAPGAERGAGTARSASPVRRAAPGETSAGGLGWKSLDSGME